MGGLFSRILLSTLEFLNEILNNNFTLSSFKSLTLNILILLYFPLAAQELK